ncbi:FAD-dependent monooxygenase [Nonomuraea sp. NPDC050556]|uniref:FAD-dependent monooxygenase n=1 Tax=Nonomuraea sp. NPDC050556 TaxID=3364369 RepID=UPI0037A655CE
MKALICGAGVAGLTLAWHLERAGWEVELVERAAGFRDGGYVIDFYGAGYQVAERMGLAPRLREARYPVNELRYLDGNGRKTSGLVMKSGLEQVISLLRADLARAVHDDVRSPISYGTSIAALSPDGTTVELTDGSSREVDLVVGADGAHSRVRELTFGPEERFVRYLDHHVAAYTFTDEQLSREVGMRYQVMTVPGLMAGAYALRDGRVATLFLRREPDPALPESPAKALREAYGGLGWILPDILDHCPDPPELYYDQITQVEMDRWSSGRVVLLGDACQAVSLFAGHGASMAMAGASILADELTSCDLPVALDRYQRRMRPAIGEVQAFGRRFIQWMAPATRRRIIARDWLMRLAALPGADRLFLRSLTPGSHLLQERERGAGPSP